MLDTLFTVLLTFVLTGLVGSRVAHAWQQRNWVVQKRIIEAEEQYKALQKTFDEVAEQAGRRQHRMFRLLSGIRQGSADIIKKRLADYDEAALAWNEKLPTSNAKLTMQLSYWLSRRLEDQIQRRFVSLDAQLTRLAKAGLSGGTLSSREFGRLSSELNSLNGQIVAFNKTVLKEIDAKKASLYQPRPFNVETLNTFPTWELFKALFKSGKNGLNIS